MMAAQRGFLDRIIACNIIELIWEADLVVVPRAAAPTAAQTICQAMAVTLPATDLASLVLLRFRTQPIQRNEMQTGNYMTYIHQLPSFYINISSEKFMLT